MNVFQKVFVRLRTAPRFVHAGIAVAAVWIPLILRAINYPWIGAAIFALLAGLFLIAVPLNLEFQRKKRN